jgi:hypothetical protein
MRRLGREARRCQVCGWITPRVAITEHRASTMRASIVTRVNRCHTRATLASNTIIDFALLTVNSPAMA